MKIGLEIHVALPTKSKLFCSCASDAEEPNSSICPICMGFPGAKPMLNIEDVRCALSIVHALHCKPKSNISFVRKVYFYPDLPKSYQITQMEGAIGSLGNFQLEHKKIGIRRIQLEEDPAKIIREGMLTLLDFNRSGVPLVEIVTDPDISNEEELREFLYKIRSILYYLDVDINKEIKADLNISLAENRVEIKNVTGIRNLIDAARYEIKRQAKCIAQGKEIAIETRGFNEKRKTTEAMREKETDEEYGYIYDSDLTFYNTSDMEYKIPVYANEIANEYAEKYGVDSKTVSELIMFDKQSLALMEGTHENYSMRDIIHAIERLKKYKITDYSIDKFKKILDAINKGIIIDKKVVIAIYSGKDVTISTNKFNDEKLEKIIREFAQRNIDIVKNYKKNKKVLNYFIGNISKEYNLHPKDVSILLRKIIDSIETEKN
jgi:aspartyl-tRNA(Asn)/glutamyl-tRNA(Gln) amidotransferase subunit B